MGTLLTGDNEEQFVTQHYRKCVKELKGSQVQYLLFKHRLMIDNFKDKNIVFYCSEKNKL